MKEFFQNIAKKLTDKRFITQMVLLAVPIISSSLSIFHLYDFSLLSNSDIGAGLLSSTIEIASLVTLFVLINIKKINIWLTWSIFILLFALQIMGNGYATFHEITSKLIEDPKHLDIFIEFMRTLGLSFRDVELDPGVTEVSLFKIILAAITSLPIPILSLIFLKMLVNVLFDKDPFGEVETKTEIKEVKSEEIKKEEVEKPNQIQPADIIKEENKPAELPENSADIHVNSNKDEILVSKLQELVPEKTIKKTFTIPVSSNKLTYEQEKESLAETIASYQEDTVFDSEIPLEIPEPITLKNALKNDELKTKLNLLESLSSHTAVVQSDPLAETATAQIDVTNEEVVEKLFNIELEKIETNQERPLIENELLPTEIQSAPLNVEEVDETIIIPSLNHDHAEIVAEPAPVKIQEDIILGTAEPFVNLKSSESRLHVALQNNNI